MIVGNIGRGREPEWVANITLPPLSNADYQILWSEPLGVGLVACYFLVAEIFLIVILLNNNFF